MSIVFKESNIISLRTACVVDRGNLVGFQLSPVEMASLLREEWQSGPRRFDWVSKDSVWLYRHMRSPSEERKLMQSPPRVDHQVKPMKFEKNPELRLCWSESGHSVALYLNGEPWAFYR